MQHIMLVKGREKYNRKQGKELRVSFMGLRRQNIYEKVIINPFYKAYLKMYYEYVE